MDSPVPHPPGLLRFGLSVLAVAAVLLVRLTLEPWLGDSSPFLLFTPAVMFAAWYGGLWPGLLATALSAAVGWHFMAPAPAGLEIEDWDRFALFLVVGLVVTWLQVKIAASTARVQTLLAREQAARSEAEAANKAKDAFLATVSHELRGPLSVVIGWASVLRSDAAASPSVQRAAEAIESNARLQSRLVEDIVESVRASRGTMRLERECVDLAPLVRGVVDAFRPTAVARGLDLKGTIPGEPSTVWGDPARLHQVLMNLLTNAAKFTPAGGSIDVGLERVGNQARVTVRDSGAGIDACFLPHMFEPFTKGNESPQGLGLGLAIVRHLVGMHGGTVTAASAGRGLGASMTLTLPLMAPAHPAGSVQGFNVIVAP